MLRELTTKKGRASSVRLLRIMFLLGLAKWDLVNLAQLQIIFSELKVRKK